MDGRLQLGQRVCKRDLIHASTTLNLANRKCQPDFTAPDIGFSVFISAP